jgi:membrane-associated protease RseP (regulator of RpoE activity)
MKKQTCRRLLLIPQTALIPLLCFVAGCSTSKQKEPPLISRGWIGGYVMVETSFPKSMIPRPKIALLITSLSTNTPAAVAGLREGDLILALDHQPIKNLRQFRHKIDPLMPGASLTVTACRDNQTNEFAVTVGRETFRRGGWFSLDLPPIAYGLELWPHGDHPGWSAVVLGYRNNSVNRVELNSVKEQYDRKCNPKDTPYNEDQKVWLVIMEFSKGKNIADQELVEAAK